MDWITSAVYAVVSACLRVVHGIVDGAVRAVLPRQISDNGFCSSLIIVLTLLLTFSICALLAWLIL